MGVEAAHAPKRLVRMASQLATTAAPAETVSTTASAAAKTAFRTKPRGRKTPRRDWGAGSSDSTFSRSRASSSGGGAQCSIAS